MTLGKIGSTDMMHHGFTAKSYVQEGLVALYDGDENAGWGHHYASTNKWTDLVSGWNLTFPSGILWAENHATSAAKITGRTTAKTTAAFGNSMTVNNEGTFEYCMKLKSIDQMTPKYSNASGQGIQFYVRYLSGVMRIRNENGAMNGSGSFFWNTGMPANALNTMTFNMKSGQKCGLYLNGVFRENSTNNCNFAKNLLIYQGGTWPLNLEIGGGDANYCIRIYNRMLSAAEIAANHAIDVARFNPNGGGHKCIVIVAIFRPCSRWSVPCSSEWRAAA